MRIPEKPPSFAELIRDLMGDRLLQLHQMVRGESLDSAYLHWDEIRRREPPQGISPQEWWLLLKLARRNAYSRLNLADKQGDKFRFAVPRMVTEQLHHIDVGSGKMIGMEEQITTPQTRDRYLVSSLMEEAITSSQLEGAVTTRVVAKEMLSSGRRPRDRSERMILNNYITMRRIRELKGESLTPALVFEIHRLVTEGTMDDATAAGRFRRDAERVFVLDDDDQVFHDPPAAAELHLRMEAMCAFANGQSPDYFVHPVLRAIILHFWLAYDHPFVDGNGRTARALFYWRMLNSGYWLFEFISISSILRKAPAQYGRSFLYTETDDNDLTYFIVAQLDVIRRAIDSLHDYIKRKSAEQRETTARIKALAMFNHRQEALLRHALQHPGQQYTITGHRTSHGVVYQTARTDLLDLTQKSLLKQYKRGKELVFMAVEDLADRLGKLSP